MTHAPSAPPWPHRCARWAACSLPGLALAMSSLTARADDTRPNAVQAAQAAQAVQDLATIVVTAPRPAQDGLAHTLNRRNGLTARRAGETDTARLLEALPGVASQGAGGLSSLPVIHGMADEQLRVQVDGMDLQAACPNHMNAALSYIAPSDVAEITVYPGITPVSVGGDSLGGTVAVRRAAPTFASEDEGSLSAGRGGAFVRSNGLAQGLHLQATLATTALAIRYAGHTAQSENVHAARAFKPAAPATEGGEPMPGDEIGSTAYHYTNHDLGLAWRHDTHLLQLDVGQQHVFFEGFPNQRMDMTGNRNATVNLRYEGRFAWGTLASRVYTQRTRHRMDMGPDRYQYGTGMPMLTRASTNGAHAMLTLPLSDEDTVRTGAEGLAYTLYDWWPPVGGSMGPRAFWNVDNGRRNRAGAFAEWDHAWREDWSSQLGLRADRVLSDASPVQGYDNGLTALWGNDAAAFNARDHRQVDLHWDFTATSTWRPGEHNALVVGYARKSHSPSLYQRYAWSTQAMAALMNNFAGDGNGYIGKEDLKPEVAHTLSATVQWQDDASAARRLQLTVYRTDIEHYIDAQRCHTGQCSAANVTATTGFVLLQYVNQRARLQGLDASAETLLHRSEAYGALRLRADLGLVHGRNEDTGQPLYNIMPPQLKLGLDWRHQGWTHSAQWQLVAGKHRVSTVRNEVPTAGYALLNLATSHAWQRARLDLRLDNALNRFYRQPLGGAYVGQGASMSSQGIPWGTAMPGPGRSLTVAVELQY